ncbi:MAG: hypothetical protein AAGA06_00115 [Pseudomonadota bacterium]
MENGIPAALAALDLVINEVPNQGPFLPEEGDESVEDTSERLDTAPASDELAVDAPAPRECSEQMSEAADVPQEKPVSEDCSAVEFTQMPEDLEDPVDDKACDMGDHAETSQAGEADTVEPTMFVRSSARIAMAEGSLNADAQVEDEPNSDVDSALDDPETGHIMDSATDDFIPDHMMETAPESDIEDAEAPPNTQSVKDDETPSDRIVEFLSAIDTRLGVLEDQQSTLAEALGSPSSSIDTMESRQMPRPDATEFNRGMAKMTVAFAHTLRRIEDSLEAARGGQEESGTSVSECLADGFGALANAIRAMNPTHVGTATDFTMIASMQETLSHQLAKLIEATQAPQPPALEEFLMDVRHATAELLAEQARIAQAV